MNTIYDQAGAPVQVANRRFSSTGTITILGCALVAIGIGAGVWWGIREASFPASSLPDSASSASINAVSTPASMAKGEVVVAQPRFVRPPTVFDPVEALAAQASLTGDIRPAALPQGRKAANVTATPVQQRIEPTGWQGKGNALLQMWDLGVQPDWAVRPAPLSPPNWRISGVVQRGEQTQAIVQFDGDPVPKFFKIGDKLPGGAKLAWVKPNVMGVVMPKAGVLAVPVLDGQSPDKAPANSQSKKP